MKPNVGGNDKALRIFAGFAIIFGGILYEQNTAILVGGIILATGLFSFCGLYTLLGMNTCPVEPKPVVKSAKKASIKKKPSKSKKK